MVTKRYTQAWRNAISKSTEPWRNERLQEVKAALLIGSNAADACKYACIAESTYYAWLKRYPNLLEEIDKIRLNPILTAQRTLMNGLASDSKLAFEYLKTKRPDDYAAGKQKVELAMPLDNEATKDPSLAVEVAAAVSEALRRRNIEANRDRDEQ